MSDGYWQMTLILVWQLCLALSTMSHSQRWRDPRRIARQLGTVATTTTGER